MPESPRDFQVLVGPRVVGDRICRLLYRRDTDDVRVEFWNEGMWVKGSALLREVLKAPSPKRSQLRKRGIPAEQGMLDGALARA